MELYHGFKTETDPETGRKLIQITDGAVSCYPLYYFIPSITEDEQYLVYHRLHNDDVQLFAIHLQTGESKQLTHATDPNPSWKIWCSHVNTGVLDHRSALNTKTNDVIYIENNNVHRVNIDSLKDEILFVIPTDRRAVGQNCVTPDGKWFVYIHHDLELHNKIATYQDWAKYMDNRRRSRETIIEGFNLETGERKDILVADAYFHHIFPYDNDHFVINHPANENGMLYTSLSGNWVTHLRTQNRDRKTICHCVPTEKGIAYEASHGHSDVIGGIYNPKNHQYTEFNLPQNFGYTHTGVDPKGELFFHENMNYVGNSRNIQTHDMYYLKEINGMDCNFAKIISHRETFKPFGQKSHFHPRMTADRRHIVFTGGCRATQTNHIYFVDVADLDKTEGFVWP